MSASAQSGFKYQSASAGFTVSLVIPDNNLHPTAGWGGLVDLGFDLGKAGKLHIVPNMDFWISSYQYDLLFDYDDYDRTTFEMGINGDVRYYFPLPDRLLVQPYVGNGIAVVINHNRHDYDFDNRNDYEDTDVEPAFNIFGGIDIKFSRDIIGFTEMRAKFGAIDVYKFTFGMKFNVNAK
jgi:hypothetical protein